MSKPSVPILRYSWIGSNKTYLDEPHVRQLSGISVGHYGGNTGSGAVKNEDAALIWKRADGEWEFGVLLDAHNTAESAALIVALLETHET